MRYPSLFERLVANTAEPENGQACWNWTGPTRRHGGGDRPSVSIRVPGVAHPRNFNAARVMLEIVEGPPPTPEHEASHLCYGNWLCVCPDHLLRETKQENMARQWSRRRST